MVTRIGICSSCDSKYTVEGEPGEELNVNCKKCNNLNKVIFTEDNLEELMVYPLENKFELIKIVKNNDTLDKYYMAVIPILKDDEIKFFKYLRETLLSTLNIRLDEIEFNKEMVEYLAKNVDEIITKYKIEIDDDLKKKLMYHINRDFIGFGKLDPVMSDPHIEDISCDGPITPLYIYHREYGSLKSNIVFDNETELSAFVVKLSQKCGKHISLSNPMLDATMPDGSRIQMTLSGEVTTKGSTFTIRKFRSDPITPTDLIEYNTMSIDMIAYLWIAVENGVNALIAGSTASGKTSTLNAFSLFIPRETKIVSIEETREINLPHENWIPGVTRIGFGEVLNNRLIGEIDLFDLMKAALRQRPEYILVGEIRGKEAYVLFQAMATGHTTYSTVHADSIKALIHRLEGKPINVPRAMLQSLDVVLLQTNIKKEDKNMRRCRQIVEIIDLDSQTNEILTNEVFRWNSKDDKFEFLGKSYVLDHIRVQYGLSKDEMKKEMERRVEVLEWMKKNNIRAFKDFAKIVSSYADKPEKLIEKVRTNPIYKIEKEKNIELGEKSKKFDEVVEKIDNIPLKNNEVKRREVFNFLSKRRKKEKDFGGRIMALTKIQKNSYKMFKNIAEKRVSEKLSHSLESAHMEIRGAVYLSVAFLLMIIGIIVSYVVMFILMFWFLPFMGITIDLFTTIFLLILPIIIGVISFFIYLQLPASTAKGRGKKIDIDLPYALNFVSAMSSAGVTPTEIFNSLSKQDIYGQIREEAAWIFRDVALLGVDILTAIKNNIKRTPSEKFGEFLQGMIVTVASGGSLKSYFIAKANQFMIENRQKQKELFETLGIMAESYVTAAVAGILLLLIVIPIMMIISGDASQLNFLYIIIFIVVPLIHIGFAFVIKSMTLEV